MGKDKAPKYDPAGDLAASTQTYLKYLPALLSAEQGFRKQYDKPRVEAQLGLQESEGKRMYADQLAALQQLDPQGTAVRQQVGQSVSQNLGTQYNLPSGLQQAVTSQARARAALTGNEFGAGPTSAEDIFQGNAANQYYQQNLANAQRFLQGPTPEQQLLAVQPVGVPGNIYVNPSAPAQAAQNNYQNYLAQYQASGAGQTPGWVGASGAIVGGIAGAYFGGGPQGAQLGAAAGSTAANASYGYFSDGRLKSHAKYVGRSPSGVPIHEFNYEWSDRRYRGVIAQEILSIRPDAVWKGPDGYYRVNYDKLDVKLEEVEHAPMV